MVRCRHLWLRRFGVAGVVWFLPVIALAHEQVLRAPDLGVWFTNQRAANGTNALIVSDLIADGVFAIAGLREGDRIVSINGRPVESESKFVQTLMAAGNHLANLVVERNAQHYALALRASTVMDHMVAVDPFYRVGLIMDENDSHSMIVQRVFACTPAFYAGLHKADVIISINGQSISSLAELTQVLRRGGNLSLVVSRGGQSRQMTMSINTDPSGRSSLSTLGRVPLRGTTTQGALSPGTIPPPPFVPFRGGLDAPPLLAPPVIPSNPPAVPSPPPAIPSPPPPGTLPTVPPV